MYTHRPPPRITRAALRPDSNIRLHLPNWGVLIGGGFPFLGEENLWNGVVLPYNHFRDVQHGITTWGALDVLDGEGVELSRDWRQDEPIWRIVYVSHETGCVERSFQREEPAFPMELVPPPGQEHPCGSAPGGPDDVDLEWSVFWFRKLADAMDTWPDALLDVVVHVTQHLEDV